MTTILEDHQRLGPSCQTIAEGLEVQVHRWTVAVLLTRQKIVAEPEFEEAPGSEASSEAAAQGYARI